METIKSYFCVFLFHFLQMAEEKVAQVYRKGGFLLLKSL